MVPDDSGVERHPGPNTGDVIFIRRPLHLLRAIISDESYAGIERTPFPPEPPKVTKPAVARKEQQRSFREHIDRKLNRGQRWPK
jgi:hypothetical protein